MQVKRFPVKTTSAKEVIDDFLLMGKAQRKSERTLKDYEWHLNRFFTLFPEAWPYELKPAVRKYFATFADKSPGYYNMTRKYLSCFFKWCVKEGYIASNPIEGIQQLKDKGKPKNIAIEDIKELLSAIDTTTYTGLRDYCLILLQLDTGIRPGEALRLLPEHFNLAKQEVFIPAPMAKTREARIVVISIETAKYIRKLLSHRPDEWGNETPVFAGQDGTEMLTASWAGRIRKYCDKAGVKLTPYQLRHTSAITMLRNGASVFHVQRQLGHASLVMTKRYITLAEADLHREHAIASPVANMFPQRQRAKRKIKEGEKE